MVSNILIEVMASVAEEERVKIHRRQEEGIAVAKAKGVVFGRPSMPSLPMMFGRKTIGIILKPEQNLFDVLAQLTRWESGSLGVYFNQPDP